jgi:hypothetical protein
LFSIETFLLEAQIKGTTSLAKKEAERDPKLFWKRFEEKDNLPPLIYAIRSSR